LLNVFYLKKRALKSHQKLCEALLGPQKRINKSSDVVYLVSPNTLNKTF